MVARIDKGDVQRESSQARRSRGEFNRGVQISERLETLKKARDRIVEDGDEHAKVLAARARNKFVEIQALIDALDRAISGKNFGSARG